MKKFKKPVWNENLNAMQVGRYARGEVYLSADRLVHHANDGEPALAEETPLGKLRSLIIAGHGIGKHLDYDVDIAGDQLIIGCNRLPAMATFKRLARALGYEVEE